LRFLKLHGAGNDFIVVTGPETAWDWRAAAPRLCARHTGIGADGLVVASVVDKDPPVLEVVCVNADGSLASMCGNALRCVAWSTSRDHGWPQMTLVMAGVRHEAVVDGRQVWVTAEAGPIQPDRIRAQWQGSTVRFDAVNTGTEHVVTVVDDVDQVDVQGLGRQIRHHRALAPTGANVNLVQVAGRQALRVRTYERGVEAETLSCASGAVAAAVVAARRGLVEPGQQVTVQNRAGTPLTVAQHPRRPGAAYWVSGPVAQAFEGEVEPA
jgi:diaminopimelate epimerase